MKKILKILLLLLVLNSSFVLADEDKKKELLSVMKTDLIFGHKDAKITMIEYSSLTCPHCAKYYNTIYPEIKKQYIDTGKVKYIHRNFPLDAPSLKGAMLLECVGKDELIPFIETLFKMQDSWAYKEDYMDQLKNIAKLGGVSEEKFDKCTSNKESENHIVQTRLDAEKILEIRSTPSFIINGEVVKGGKDLEFFTKKLEELLVENGTKSE